MLINLSGLTTILLALFLPATELLAAAPEANKKLLPSPPFPSTVVAAKQTGILLEPIEAFTSGDQLTPGDSITALITLFQKGAKSTQWLLYLETQATNSKSISTNVPHPMVLYSSFGNKLTFDSSPAKAKLRLLGPFGEGSAVISKMHDKTTQLEVDQGFLSLGIDRAAAIIYQLRQQNIKGAFNFGPKPFSKAQIEQDSKLAASLHISSEDERAVAGSVPALMSYFNIVEEIPGLKDILIKVVDMPSIWSMIRHAGVDADLAVQPENMGPIALNSWSLPKDAATFQLPIKLDLNGQPALRLTFFVTAPKRPLLLCGGIIGFLAEKPGDEQTYLMLRIVRATARPE
jgi:hypothetical protein